MNYDNLFSRYEVKTLKYNELIEYMKLIKLGNLKAREILINSNVALVISRVLKKFSNTPYENNELISTGLIGLMKAVDTFDIEKGYKFSTYAAKCIDNEILIFLRKGKKHLETDSLNRVFISNQDGDLTTLEELITDGYDFTLNLFEKEELKEIRNQVERLNERDKEIIKLYFGFYNNRRYTQEEIAKLLNIKQSNISKKLKKIIIKIKQNMLEEDLIEPKTYSK